MATLQALTAMMPWDCIEYVANNDRGSCEAYLALPRELKENSNTLETKLKAAGFSSIMLLTFPPSDGNKTAAACVDRIRTKRDDPDASYCKIGSHDRTLENRIPGKLAPAAAGGGRGGAGPQLQSRQEFDEKTKAVMEATGKTCGEINDNVVTLMGRVVTTSALDDKLAPIARKEDMTSMATKVDEMSAHLERSNETIAAHEASIRTLQTTIAANEAAIQARDTTIAGHEATIRTLQTTVAANEATIAVNESAIATLEEKNSRHEKKIADQGCMLGKLRPVQTDLAKTKEELKAMTNYRDAAVRTSAITIENLRRELFDAQRDVRLETEKLEDARRVWDDERRAWNDEREKWRAEREYLIAAADNNESVIIAHYQKHMMSYQSPLKRPRTDAASGAAPGSA